MEQLEKLNSVEKALRILLAFRTDRPAWGVRELSAHLGFSPATVQRIIQTLRAYGFIDQDPLTRQYRLGHVYFQFLDVLQSAHPVTREALPHMKRLVSRTQETAHLNIIDGLERICIESIESLQSLKAGMPVGNRSPLYAGASSKCLLAFSPSEFVESYLDQTVLSPLTERTIARTDALRGELERIREQGYAESLGERTPGLGSLSVPVRSHRGILAAALSLAIPEIRYRSEAHRRFCLEALKDAAAEISRAMGYSDGRA